MQRAGLVEEAQPGLCSPPLTSSLFPTVISACRLCEILTSLLKPLFACPGFETFPFTSPFTWSDNSKCLQCGAGVLCCTETWPPGLTSNLSSKGNETASWDCFSWFIFHHSYYQRPTGAIQLMLTFAHFISCLGRGCCICSAC